jgi:hypothetical protein
VKPTFNHGVGFAAPRPNRFQNLLGLLASGNIVKVREHLHFLENIKAESLILTAT